MHRKSLKFVYKVISIAILFYLIDLFGILTHVLELEYDVFFHYPLEDRLLFEHFERQNKSTPLHSINNYNYTYIYNPSKKCNDELVLRLTLIIKSAMENSQRREIIRRTWGNERRFSDTVIRRVFILGKSESVDIMNAIIAEEKLNKDIVQLDFVDNYFNNTIKTVSGIRWATEHCSKSQYYLFVDDDYYISVKNVLRFIAHPHQYPQYYSNVQEKERVYLRTANVYNSHNDNDLNEDLFAGFVFQTSPHRHKMSKWYVSLKEYPFDRWPPYVTAGAFILSRNTLSKLYLFSTFTKHFRFDDIFLGIVALKAKIPLTHCDRFYFRKLKYSGPVSYRFVIASHGFDDPIDMERVWNECYTAALA